MKKVKKMGKILGLTAVITVVLILILAAVAWGLEWGGKLIGVGVTFLYGFCSFFGGFFTGKMAEKRQYLWGLLFGSVYFLLILLICLGAGSGLSLHRGVWCNLLICLASGMLGGMLS